MTRGAPWRPTVGLLFAGLVVAAAEGAPAQLLPAPGIGEPAGERLRTEQVLGRAPTDGFLLRRAEPEDVEDPGWALLAPDVTVAWNSALPEGENDGLLWAGRGASMRLRAGAVARRGPVKLTLAPELAYMRNLGFQVRPGADSTRSGFSSPFYVGRQSADLPLRMGTEPLVFVHPGQTTLSVDAGRVRLGASTANQWWGPGVRNALLLSNHAPGFFHLFAETAEPIRTPAGALEGRWLVGSLVESLYFDDDGGNDLRSLSGLVLTLRPAGLETLTLGLARTVVAPLDGLGALPGDFHHALTRWDGLPGSPGGEDPPATDGLTALFARWIHPDAGVEVYGEWARAEPPGSVRELLTAPQHSQAWTAGLQWAEALDDDGRRVRLQVEATNLEQTRILPDRPTPPDYYTGRAAPQGFTHRGQVLGAAVGPGGSSQWLAGDYLTAEWSAGAFLERVRRNNDALYRRHAITFFQHDVTLSGGVRGDARVGGARLHGLAALGKRFNYLFQNGINRPAGLRTVDVWNLRLELGATMDVGR